MISFLVDAFLHVDKTFLKFIRDQEITTTEVGLLVLVIVAGWLLGKWGALYTRNHWKKTWKAEWANTMMRGLVLVPPITVFLSISLSRAILENIFNLGIYTFEQAQDIALIWGLGRALFTFFKKQTAWRILIFVLIPLAFILMRNISNDVLMVLEHWVITIGNKKISVFKILESFILVLMLYWAARQLVWVADKRIDKIDFVPAEMRALSIKFFQIILYTMFFFIALDILGISLKSFAFFGGALGIGIGFGFRRIAASFISGVILLMEESIKTNDIVELADGTSCLVKKIYARYTLAETFDGKEVLVPNEELISTRVSSWTHSHKRARRTLTIDVSYNSDLPLAQKLILEAANEHPRCAQKPEDQKAACYLDSFAASSVQFVMMFWIKNIDEGLQEPTSEILFAIAKKFNQYGVQFPYPQQDIHIRTLPPKFSMPPPQPASRKKSSPSSSAPRDTS